MTWNWTSNIRNTPEVDPIKPFYRWQKKFPFFAVKLACLQLLEKISSKIKWHSLTAKIGKRRKISFIGSATDLIKMSFAISFFRWYPLQCKPGQKKSDYRGELEVRTSFTVKAVSNAPADGSSLDLTNKKNKGSLQSLNKVASNFGGSLLSLGQKVRILELSALRIFK